MIIKLVKELGYDVDNWCPTSINVSPIGDTGKCIVTFGVFKDHAEYQKSPNNHLNTTEVSVEVSVKVFTDLITAIEQEAVATQGGFFEGCPIE